MAHPWELTHQLSQYFDPHLIIPLLEFLTANGMYSETDLSKAKLELLKGTSMVDFYIEEHKKYELSHVFSNSVTTNLRKNNSRNFSSCVFFYKVEFLTQIKLWKTIQMF